MIFSTRFLTATGLSFLLCHSISAQVQDTWVQKNDIGISVANGFGSMEYGVGFAIGSKGYFGTGNDDIYRKEFWEYDTATNVWTQKADFGGGKRNHAVGFSIGAKGYVGTGFDSTSNYKDLWEYNPSANAWTQKADFGGGYRSSAVAFTANGKGYVGTGWDGTAFRKDLWEYNPTADAWSQKDTLGGVARSGAFAFSFGDRGYIGNGGSATTYNSYTYSDLWMYDPVADTFVQKASLPVAGKTSACTFSLGRFGYICGGGASVAGNQLWRYDTSANAWTQKTNVPGTRGGAAGFAIGPTGYVIAGGFNRYDTWAYDTTTDSWTEKAKVGSGIRSQAVAFNIGSTGYMGLGQNGGYFKDWWAFDLPTSVWTQKADYGGGVRFAAVGFAIGTYGYVGTGATNGTPGYSDFWRYDPATNTWAQKASYAGGVVSSAVGFGIGSKGYIGTGAGGSGLVSSFYEYDPGTDIWTARANYPGGTRQLAAAFSIGSKGYIGTGLSGSNYSDFYEYNPATNSWTQKSNYPGGGRYATVSFSSASRGYVGGGVGSYGNFYSDFYEYNPTTNVWTVRSNIPYARRDARGFATGNRAYIGTGLSDYGLRKDFWEYTPVFFQVGTVSGPYCAAFNVPFTSDTLNIGNVYTAQLSNASGSFASPVNIGTLASNVSGAIICNIPVATAPGTGYRVRIVSSSPYLISQDNGSNITVAAPVTPTISISTPTPAFCVGSTVTFTATPTIGGNTPAFQWKVNGINSGTNSNTFTYAAAAGDTVTCVLTSNSPCASTSTVWSNAVVLNTITSVTTSISINATNTSICSGTSVSFTATATGGAASYQWKINGANAGTNATTYTYAPANGDTIRCVMTSLHSCATTPVVTSNAIVMTVNPTGTLAATIAANYSISGSTVTTCSSNTLVLTANVTNGGSSPTFQWYTFAGSTATPISGATSATYTASSINRTYYVVIGGSQPCITPVSVTKGPLNAVFTSAVTPGVNISTSATSLCAGVAATFTATATNGGTAPTYQWQVNSISAGTNSNSFTYTPTNGDTVRCLLTSNAACVTSTTAVSNAVVMIVTPSVTPAVSVTATSGSVCAGTVVTCNASATNGGLAPGYQWKANGVNVGTGGNSYSFTPSNGDVVTCQLTSNASCVTTSSATSNGVTFVVTPTVIPSIAVSASPSNTVCANTAVTFTASATNGGSSPGYQWKVNASNVGSGSSSYSYTPSNSDVVACVLTSNAACATAATANSNSVTMTVNPVLTPVVAIVSGSGSTVCSGTSVTYTANPTNGGTSPSYQWKVNGSNAGTNNSSYTYSPSNGDTISCVMTSGAACLLSATATSNSITMTVNPTLATAISVTSNASIICAGTTVTYTASSTNGGAAPAYQWKVNSTNVGTNSTSYSYAPAVFDTVRCVLVSSAVCATPATIASAGAVVTVTPKDTPSLIITAAPANQVCSGTLVNFTAASKHGGTSPAYQWTLNSANVGTNSGTYANAILNQGDTISCIMTSSAACITQPAASSNRIAMTVYPLPSPLIARNGAVLNSGVSGGSYMWYLNGSAVTAATGASYLPIQNGSYTVAVTDAHGCTMTSAPFNVSYVGIETVTGKATISYYPNPANSTVHIESPTPVNVQILSMDGRVIIAKDATLTIDIGRLPDGVYTIVISDAKSQKLRIGKLVKTGS